MVSRFLREIGVRAVVADVPEYERNINKMRDSQDKLSKSAEETSKRFKLVGTAITGFGVAGAFVGKQFIGLASDLSESMNAVNVIFGDASDIINDFGENTARSVGLSTAAFNQLASQTGALLLDTGLPLKEIATLTTDLAVRAADMASIMNTDVTQAFDAIGQAIRGETEAIRFFSGDVTDATLQQFLLAQGINKTVTEMDQQEKKLLRIQVLMAQTEKFAGDFARTSEDLANAQRTVSSELENLGAKIGTVLLPVATEAVLTVGNFTKTLDELDPRLLKIGVLAGATATGLALIVGPGLVIIGFLPKLSAGMIIATKVMTAFTAASRAAALSLLGPLGIALALGAAAVALAVWAKRTEDARRETELLGSSFDSLKTRIQTLPLEFLVAEGERIVLTMVAQEKAISENEKALRKLTGTTLKEVTQAKSLRDIINKQRADLAFTSEAFKEVTDRITEMTESQEDSTIAIEEATKATELQKDEIEKLTRIHQRFTDRVRQGNSDLVEQDIVFQNTIRTIQEQENELLGLIATVGDGADAWKLYKDRQITVAQAIETLRSLQEDQKRRQEEEQRRLQDLSNEWAGVRRAIADTGNQMVQSGLSMNEIIALWAQVTSQSTASILSDLQAQGIGIDVLITDWEALGIPLEAIIALHKEMTQAALEQAAAERELADALRDVANAAGISLGPGGPGLIPPTTGQITTAFDALIQNIIGAGVPIPEFLDFGFFADLVLSFFNSGMDAAGALLAAIRQLELRILPDDQHGGFHPRSTQAIVGERGPEFVSLPGGSQVTPGNTDRSFNPTVNANYTNPQEPAGIMADLESLALLASI